MVRSSPYDTGKQRLRRRESIVFRLVLLLFGLVLTGQTFTLSILGIVAGELDNDLASRTVVISIATLILGTPTLLLSSVVFSQIFSSRWYSISVAIWVIMVSITISGLQQGDEGLTSAITILIVSSIAILIIEGLILFVGPRFTIQSTSIRGKSRSNRTRSSSFPDLS